VWISGSGFEKPPFFSGKTAIHESLSRVLVFSGFLHVQRFFAGAVQR